MTTDSKLFDTQPDTRRLIRLGAALVAALLLITATAGCSDSPLEPQTPSTPATIMMGAHITAFHSFDQSHSLTATVTDQHGQVIVDPQLTWSLGEEGVVEMTAPGVFRSVANGEVELTVRAGDSPSGTVVRTHRMVVDQRPAGIGFVTPGLGPIALDEPFRLGWIGEELNLSASLLDANGYPIDQPMPEIRWGIRDSDVLQWTEDGRLVVASSGHTTLQVRAGVWSATLPVLVAADLDLDWCASFDIPRPDAPEGGLERCDSTTVTFEREAD